MGIIFINSCGINHFWKKSLIMYKISVEDLLKSKCDCHNYNIIQLKHYLLDEYKSLTNKNEISNIKPLVLIYNNELVSCCEFEKNDKDYIFNIYFIENNNLDLKEVIYSYLIKFIKIYNLNNNHSFICYNNDSKITNALKQLGFFDILYKLNIKLFFDSYK